MPNIKNILIFLAVAGVFVFLYIFFVKPDSSEKNQSAIVSSTAPLGSQDTQNKAEAQNTNDNITKEFLGTLLSVKSIKINDAIFSDPAFISLHDSSITLVPDGNEGRINPFAQFGSDAVLIVSPVCVSPKVLDKTTNTCVNPPLN